MINNNAFEAVGKLKYLDVVLISVHSMQDEMSARIKTGMRVLIQFESLFIVQICS